MRWKSLAVGLLLLATCPAFAQQQPKEATGPKAPPSETVVLATVNDVTITIKDFQDAVAALPPQQQLVALQNREEFLDSLVKRELVFQEAKKRQLENDPEVAELIAQVRKEVLIQSLLRKIIGSTQDVDDSEAEHFYLEHKDKFKTPEKIAASHIVLKNEEEALSTLADLKKGKDFSTLAKERSIGPRASQGGFLGSISRGEMPLEFDQVAFNLPVNTLSDVVKTPFGYHIIKVSEHIPSKQLGFNEVADQIQRRLKGDRQKATVRSFLDELTAKASVEVHPERLSNPAP